MFMKNAYQNAYVTRNRDKAIATLRDRHGMTEEFILFEPDIEVRTPGGVGRAQTRVALGWTGDLQIEIIEPVSGYVDHYVAMMPRDRTDAVPRFHHMSFRRDDEAAMREEIASLGLPLAFEGPLSIKTAIQASSSSISTPGRRSATTSNSPGRVLKPGSTWVGPKAGRCTDG